MNWRLNWKILILGAFVISLAFFVELAFLIWGIASIIIGYLLIVKLSGKLTKRKEEDLEKLFITAIIVIISLSIFFVLIL